MAANGDPLLAAVRLQTDAGNTFVSVSPPETSLYAPWPPEMAERLKQLVDTEFGRRLSCLLPATVYRSILRQGVKRFQDLFLSRQLLVGLEYVNGIHELFDQMRQAAIPAERVEALTTYLAFFVGYLVDRNSTLCGWNATKRDGGTSLDRQAAFLPRVFVERSPFGMIDRWLSNVIPAIEATLLAAAPANIYLGDACSLPFADDFFDAVVTDPPYYDSVSYAELSDFFWIWESAALSKVTHLSHLAGKTGEHLETKTQADADDAYRRLVLIAFREIFRVLKPARRLCLFFFVRSSEDFQEYLNLCQSAGFELVDVRSLPEPLRQLHYFGDQPTYVTYLIYLRKPVEQSSREPLLAADAELLLAAADAGRPILYAGLAELLEQELSKADLAEVLPVGGKGANVEQLMELLADADPRQLLEKCFGKRGLRDIAARLSAAANSESSISPIELILTHFGFSIPCSSSRLDGAPQVRQKLRIMRARIVQSADKVEIRGPFVEACTAVERLLRISIWGWTQLVFGGERDNQLLSILCAENPNKQFNLNRLAMGDILAIFRRLPDAIASSLAVTVIERKFGRRHIYTNKQLKFVEILDKLVGFRNKVEHDKDGYWTNVDTSQARNDLAPVLDQAERLLVELVDAKAIPIVVEPIKEVRDKFNRKTYVLTADDGTILEARFSATLILGKSYLYFGTEVNPRPVDPLLLSFDEIGNIP